MAGQTGQHPGYLVLLPKAMLLEKLREAISVNWKRTVGMCKNWLNPKIRIYCKKKIALFTFSTHGSASSLCSKQSQNRQWPLSWVISCWLSLPPSRAKHLTEQGSKTEGWRLFCLNHHLPLLKSAPCPIPPSWYLLACSQVDDAASHLFLWAADGLCGCCMGTDLGKLSISHCFNRSSFNHLAGFHLEVLNSIIRDFAVRKIKSGWPWQSRSLILPDLFGKTE